MTSPTYTIKSGGTQIQRGISVDPFICEETKDHEIKKLFLGHKTENGRNGVELLLAESHFFPAYSMQPFKTEKKILHLKLE